jgi:PKD domain
MTLPQPYPPGQEIAHAGNSDAAHGGNVVGVRVKVPGGEMSRIWPDGTLPGMPGPEPSPPTASFTASPPAPNKNQNVTLDGTGSAPGDPAWPVTGYDWAFSDGTAGKSGAVVTWRTSNKSGSYTVTLTVTDGLGQSGQSGQVFTF